MTNYEQIKGLFQKFAHKYKRQICIETELSSASEDKAETKRTGDKKLVYENNRQDLKIIDMDEIAHNVYRIARFPDSVKESESLASADAFAISSEDIWYFIEFKNQKISKAKDSVTKKAFQNWYWIVDILYELKDKNNMQYNTFNYDNPIAFAKENVDYMENQSMLTVLKKEKIENGETVVLYRHPNFREEYRTERQKQGHL